MLSICIFYEVLSLHQQKYTKDRNSAKEGRNKYSSYDSVSAMLSNLGWRNRTASANQNIHGIGREVPNAVGAPSIAVMIRVSRYFFFYKIQYGLGAAPMPPYFEHPTSHSPHASPQFPPRVHVSADYYRFSFFSL